MNYPYYIIKKTQIEELFIFQIETPKNSVQSLDRSVTIFNLLFAS